LSSAELKESDLALIGRVRSGEAGAMALLYDRFASVVYGVALRTLGDAEAAEDVLQEVFLQLWRNPAAFDSSRGSLAAWLAVIARNRALDQRRRRRPEVDIDNVVLPVQVDLADASEKDRFLRKVRGALAAMPGPQRSALEKAFFQGMTHTEIAEETGEPLGTVKTRIRTAVLTLREALGS
jgi:RNA polymerase sigma-70 factor, ECF subfamily